MIITILAWLLSADSANTDRWETDDSERLLASALSNAASTLWRHG
jgi:hypothetical protein